MPPARLQASALDSHSQTSFPFQQVVSYLPQRRHVLGHVVQSHPALVLPECDVQAPVQRVLNAPVCPRRCQRPAQAVQCRDLHTVARLGCWRRRRWTPTPGLIRRVSHSTFAGPRFWHGSVMLRRVDFRLCWKTSLSGRVGHHSFAPVVRFAAAIDTPVSGDVQTLARLTSPPFPFTPLYAIIGAVICSPV